MSANSERLPRAFYARPTLEVAPDLLGLWLVHELPGGCRSGRIVEVEAYGGLDDLASHASKGQTARTRVMYGPPGHAYVYLIYGMYHCFNVVAHADGEAGAVLIRALEPDAGLLEGTNGPGRLGRALGIDRTLNGLDLTAETTGPLWLERRNSAPLGQVHRSARINVEYAGAWAALPWRFYLPESRHVSVRPRRPPRASGPTHPADA
ncbi:MAG: DNA-3-methyladenine glycosylase [Chloroflexi bacterium]|nr:DNA-3-methyladenine glycosylase [Chloroflexota bacterium]